SELVKKNTWVIFGKIHPSTLETVVSLTEKNGVLYVTTSDVNFFFRDAETRGTGIVKMRPMVQTGILKMIERYKWNKILYVYDCMEALQRLRMLLRLTNTGYNNNKLTVDARNIEKNTEDLKIKELLDYHSHSLIPKYIILDIIEPKLLRSLLSQVIALKLERADYHFFIVECDFRQINDTHQFGGFNITAFAPVHYDNIDASMLKHLKNRTNILDEEVEIPYSYALFVDSLSFIFRCLNQLSSSTAPFIDTLKATIQN
ncbi:Glutamate receptor 1, partial [Cichlidogyrus casuarinus]